MWLVYALYGKHTFSSNFGTFAVLIEFVTTIVSVASAIPTALYDSSCVMIQVPKTILVFVVGTFTSQAILLWLAYRKRECAVRARSSIACVTIRDGLFAFLCIAGKRINFHRIEELSQHARKYFLCVFSFGHCTIAL